MFGLLDLTDDLLQTRLLFAASSSTDDDDGAAPEPSALALTCRRLHALLPPRTPGRLRILRIRLVQPWLHTVDDWAVFLAPQLPADWDGRALHLVTPPSPEEDEDEQITRFHANAIGEPTRARAVEPFWGLSLCLQAAKRLGVAGHIRHLGLAYRVPLLVFDLDLTNLPGATYYTEDMGEELYHVLRDDTPGLRTVSVRFGGRYTHADHYYIDWLRGVDTFESIFQLRDLAMHTGTVHRNLYDQLLHPVARALSNREDGIEELRLGYEGELSPQLDVVYDSTFTEENGDEQPNYFYLRMDIDDYILLFLHEVAADTVGQFMITLSRDRSRRHSWGMMALGAPFYNVTKLPPQRARRVRLALRHGTWDDTDVDMFWHILPGLSVGRVELLTEADTHPTFGPPISGWDEVRQRTVPMELSWRPEGAPEWLTCTC